ncbi:MAG TPA: FAD-binding oxidoreductase [Sphingomicrobium sp.]|nr:FAD-binding oxidoreductase [Sphingomicrobium sp.]
MSDFNHVKLSRRLLLGSIAAVPAAAAFARARLPLAAPVTRARPGSPGWPTKAEWGALSNQVGGRLIPGGRASAAPPAELLSNPFYVGDQVGLTQSSGWLGAWRSEPSVYAVRAESASDVSTAVRFAARHRLRLVVKGGGHSYLGGSNAPDSLLVWTRGMDKIELHDAFVPQGCRSAPTPAVSVGAGCIWGRVYRAVSVEAGRYVQGGGCTTVGVAGLVQGGGFGSYSKGFGLAAASLLEAEIVTADGKVRIVNARRDPDLFWALKGGGGGTFGIVTRLTLQTYELPETFGVVRFTVQAPSDESFRDLLRDFLDFSGRSLVNPHWGEQVHATPDRRLVVEMNYQGIDGAEAKSVWEPFVHHVEANAREWKIVQPFLTLDIPARHFWDADWFSSRVPQAINRDHRPGSRPGDYWWAGDGDQVGAFWSAYTSAWLPKFLLQGSGKERLANAWSAAARHAPVSFHFNKGLAGAAPEVLRASRNTAMNPEVLDAFALAIIADGGPAAYPEWSEPDTREAEASSARVRAADRAIRAAAPNAGSYMSECDYFLPDWKRASWGPHWPRLEAIKRRYDPDGLFVVHHGVGSDRWSSDGFRRA